MASIFTKIIKGEIPSHKVAETNEFLAILDIRPVTEGHTLCMPKKEVDLVWDLDDETYIGLMLFSKSIARALMQVYPNKRITTATIGLEVPHTHVHLIPAAQMSDIDFAKAKEADPTTLEATATKIRLAL